jgi:hypothetical protein
MKYIGTVALLLSSVLVSAEPPLKCGKYQHVENDRFVRDPSVHGYIEGIRIDHTPHCEFDVHPVTEKEWQELMARLQAMDKYIKGSICYNMGYESVVISTDGGKTFVNCADMKPKP